MAVLEVLGFLTRQADGRSHFLHGLAEDALPAAAVPLAFAANEVVHDIHCPGLGRVLIVVQHVSYRKQFVKKAQHLLFLLLLGKSLAPEVKLVGGGVCLALRLRGEAALHLLAPVQAAGVDEVAHQVASHLIYNEPEFRLAVLSHDTLHGEEVVGLMKVVLYHAVRPHTGVRLVVFPPYNGHSAARHGDTDI